MTSNNSSRLFILLSVFFQTLTGQSVCFADDDTFFLKVSTYYGASQFSGDLSHDKSANTFGLSLTSGPVILPSNTQSLDTSFLNYMAVDLYLVNAKTDDTSFPFTADKGISLFTTTLAVGHCWLLDGQLSPCLGLGIGSTSVTQSNENMQSYSSSPVFVLHIPYRFPSRFSLQADVRALNVEQIHDKELSNFTMISTGFGAGWSF